VKKLWLSFALVCVFSFSVLGWIGVRIYQQMPPIPTRVVDTNGAVKIGDGAIQRGQNIWKSLGGMHVGSIWGHGSYVAPDWTADWLHRELTFVLDEWATGEFGKPYEQLGAEQQGALRGRLEGMYRQNTHDAATNTIRVDMARGRAFDACLKHYSQVFQQGNASYAMPAGMIRSDERMRDLAAFIFWTAWTSSTRRPDDNVTYTNNWPHEPLIGNRPTTVARLVATVD
jgi:nitric oxide reductase subunit B